MGEGTIGGTIGEASDFFAWRCPCEKESNDMTPGSQNKIIIPIALTYKRQISFNRR